MTRQTIGVIMAARDVEPWIAAAVSSVLGQTWHDVRLAVVDDGSEDRTASAAEARAALVNDPRITVERTGPLGVAAAKARALETLLSMREVTHVAVQDADDTCDLRRLERQMRRLELSGADICYTTYAWIDADGRRMRSMAPRRANATALCRREWYERIGGWALGGPAWGSDTRTLDAMRALGAVEETVLDELYMQRRHPGQTTQRRRRGEL